MRRGPMWQCAINACSRWNGEGSRTPLAMPCAAQITRDEERCCAAAGVRVHATGGLHGAPEACAPAVYQSTGGHDRAGPERMSGNGNAGASPIRTTPRGGSTRGPPGSRDGEKESCAITPWRGGAAHRSWLSVQCGLRLMADMGNTPAHRPGTMAQQRLRICSCTEARQ
jgi:hypothetical protein